MTDYRVPLAIRLLVVVGIVLAVNRLAPDLIGALLALLALYLAATNAHRLVPLFSTAPGALGALFGSSRPRHTTRPRIPTGQ